MATNIDTNGIPISQLPSEQPSGIEVVGYKPGRTVKVSLDLLATKEELSQISISIKWYPTSTELDLKRPNPTDGETAWVGTPYPGTVWSSDNGVWSDTGEIPDVGSIDLVEYAKSGGSIKTVQNLDDSKAELSNTDGDMVVYAPNGKVDLSEKQTANNPFIPTIRGNGTMPVEQWRKFILGLELNIAYNSSLYYSPAIVNISGSNITIEIYSATDRWTGANKIKVASFALSGTNTIGVTNEYGSIVIDSNYKPASNLSSQWHGYAGLSADVFHLDNSESIRIFKSQTQILSKAPLSDIEYNPFLTNIQGSTAMPVEQWRKFILGLELNIAYNSSLYYSVTIVNITATDISIYIWSSKSRWSNQEGVQVARFVVPKENVQYIENEFGIIVVDTNYAPISNISSQWAAYSGITSSVFKKDNSEVIRLYNATRNVTPLISSFEAFLPPKLYATVGLEFNLYYDTYILCPEYGNGQPPFMFDIDCQKGLMDKRSYRFTPTVTDIGEFDFTLRMLDNSGNVQKTYTSKLVVVAAQCPDTEKLLVEIGDSTKDDTAESTKQLQLNLAACTGTTPLFLGSHHPAPYRNEARSGLTYASYANTRLAYRFEVEDVDPNIDLSDIYKFRGYYYNNISNPVILTHRWKIGADGKGFIIGYYFTDTFQPPTTFPAYLTPTNPSNPTIKVTGYRRINFSIFRDNDGTGGRNIAYYRTEVLGLSPSQKIDVVTMDCGINDCTGPLMSDTALNAVITNISDLITMFKADNANTKFVLCLPKSRNSDLRLTSRDMLRYNIFNLSKKIVDTFSTNESVIISQSGLAMDRFYGYPLVQQTVASRYSETLLMANNDVHPRTEGYHQVADGMTGAVLVALI